MPRSEPALRWRNLGAHWMVEHPLRRYLLNTGSLTANLETLCPAEGIDVQVLYEARDRLDPGEARKLGLPGRARAWVREVGLLCGKEPWVFAHSVMPPRTLTGPGRRLLRLGTRPLGAALFAESGLRRGPIELTWVPAGALRYVGFGRLVAAAAGDRGCWGRRSLFHVASGRPLLVCEFFLPALVEHLRSSGLS